MHLMWEPGILYVGLHFQERAVQILSELGQKKKKITP